MPSADPDRHKTTAWPLACAYGALVVYATLYPFDEWRAQGVSPWAFMFEALPRYWTYFDVVANMLGYGPLGLLLALGILRSRTHRHPQAAALWAVLLASLLASALSALLEGLQTYLPSRVPSNLDWILNTAGAVLGAVLAALLEPMGAIARWSRWRARWFVADARGALVLLALWPAALLFPASVPLGLGQVMERLEASLALWLQDTPFLQWLPVRDVELQPLVPLAEIACVALGLLAPCLLAYCVTPSKRRRLLLALSACAVGVGVTALSAALSFGPEHAWAWLTRPVLAGAVAGMLLAMVLLALPSRGCAAILFLALVLHLGLLNQAPASAYFADTLQTWEQGRFIRFHGLSQWLGWLWPFAVLVYMLARLSRARPAP
jgi:VanZ family protein